ncbi:FAD-dependent oxidoreductase [Spirillospora sp. NPDC052242]
MNVVVIGGGYAGVMAANRLTQRADVTLVNPRPVFVERIRLHQLVGGSDDAVVDYGEILADGVRLVVGTAAAIDADGRRVTLEDGAVLDYDYLVYAVGSGADPGVPGAAEFAYPIAALEEAGRLRDAVDGASSVTVVGGGPLGIETAAELAEAGRDVTLVCGERLGPYLHPRGRRAVARGLAKLGVTVLEGVTATAVKRDAVRLSDGLELASTVTVWAAGFGVPDLAARSGLTTDAVGRLLTDETLTSVDDPRIVATGDAAAPSGAPLRMSCQAALPLGAHAADTVLARIAGEAPADFGKGIAAMCVSLGRRAGVFQLAHRDDTATWIHVGGRLGAKLKEAACESPIKQLAKEAREPGSHTWPVKDAKRRRLPVAGAAAG